MSVEIPFMSNLESQLYDAPGSTDPVAKLDVISMIEDQEKRSISSLLGPENLTPEFEGIFVRRELVMGEAENFKYLKKIGKDGVVHVLSQQGDGLVLSSSYDFWQGVKKLGEASEAMLAPGVQIVNYDGVDRELHTTDIAVLRSEDSYPGKEEAEEISAEFDALSEVAIPWGTPVDKVDAILARRAEKRAVEAEKRLELIGREIEIAKLKLDTDAFLAETRAEIKSFRDASNRIADVEKRSMAKVDSEVGKANWDSEFEKAVRESEEKKEKKELLVKLGAGLKVLEGTRTSESVKVSVPEVLPIRQNIKIIGQVLGRRAVDSVKERGSDLSKATKPAVKGAGIGLRFGLAAIATELIIRTKKPTSGEISRGGSEVPMGDLVPGVFTPIGEAIPVSPEPTESAPVFAQVPEKKSVSELMPDGKTKKITYLDHYGHSQVRYHKNGRFVKESSLSNDDSSAQIRISDQADLVPEVGTTVEVFVSTTSLITEPDGGENGRGNLIFKARGGFELELTLGEDLSRKDRRRVEAIIAQYDPAESLDATLRRISEVIKQEDIDLIPLRAS